MEEHNSLVSDDQEIEISKEQIERVIKELKNGKCPGPDRICDEMLKYGGQNIFQELYKLFNNIKISTIPNEWRQSVTIPIF